MAALMKIHAKLLSTLMLERKKEREKTRMNIQTEAQREKNLTTVL